MIEWSPLNKQRNSPLQFFYGNEEELMNKLNFTGNAFRREGYELLML